MENILSEEQLKMLEELNEDKDSKDEVAVYKIYSNYVSFVAYITYAIKEENDDWVLYGYKKISNDFVKGKIASLKEINSLNELYLNANVLIIELDTKFRKTKILTLVKNKKIDKEILK